MIVRLIDIVLIVLFGFITISDINIKATLQLPANTKIIDRPNRVPPVKIEIEIDLSLIHI